MNHRSTLSLALIALLSTFLFGSGSALAKNGYAEGRLLVKPAPGLKADKFDKILRKINGNAKSKRKLRNLDVHLVEVPARSEKAIARLLARHPNIAFAELDELVPPDAVVNDPGYAQQWHLPVMGADSAWQVTDGNGVVVAVLDTGVNANHQDLSGQVLSGWNTVSNNTDSNDIHNHGTWVAGVIAAKANNLLGGASVAPGARILPVRITNDASGYAYFSDMAEGVRWAADNGARVANISYGGAAGSATVANAASYMMGKGGVVMISAGNDNTDYGYTNHASLYVVGATTSGETRASYSSFGNFVDIAAPGSGIYTTARNGGYNSVNGTSFASPNTAAVAALVMAANPSLLPTDVLAVLSNTAVDLGNAGWDPLYGHGRVDALAATQLAASVETSDTTAPAVSILSPSAGENVSDLVSITIDARDDFGVEHVELLVDGEFYASSNQALPANLYDFTWDSTAVGDGDYTLSARAYDAAGNIGTAGNVTVRVANNAADDAEPPVVRILSPSDGASGSGRITLSADASDNVGVTQISLYAGGKLRCAATRTVSCTWNLRKVTPSTYTISAVAVDAAGNQGNAAVEFTVGGTNDGGGKGGGKGRKNK